MQGNRNLDVIMRISDYCIEINNTVERFGRQSQMTFLNYKTIVLK